MVERGLFRQAYEMVMEEPKTFLLGGAILSALNLATSGLLIGPSLVGICGTVLKRRRGETVSLSDLFCGFEDFGHTFLAGLVYGLGLAAGLLLLILPGLAFGAAFFPMFPLMAEHRLSFPEAFARSWQLTLPDLLEHSLMFTLALALASAGLLIFFFGVVLTLPLAVVTLVLAYEECARRSSPEPPGPSAVAGDTT
ncbi:MAG: hypothetical protein V3U98_12605 [Acidobacteriota bacterium]